MFFDIFEISEMYLFDFFRFVQKVFPRIPGGCRHTESDENRVLNIFYLSFGDIVFVDMFEMLLLKK